MSLQGFRISNITVGKYEADMYKLFFVSEVVLYQTKCFSSGKWEWTCKCLCHSVCFMSLYCHFSFILDSHSLETMHSFSNIQNNKGSPVVIVTFFSTERKRKSPSQVLVSFTFGAKKAKIMETM